MTTRELSMKGRGAVDEAPAGAALPAGSSRLPAAMEGGLPAAAEGGLPGEAEPGLPIEADFGLEVDRVGPIRAEDFEEWEQDDDNPVELIAGWVLPMSPQGHATGSAIIELIVLLHPIVKELGWTISLDERQRFVRPPQTVLYPDVAIYRTRDLGVVPGTQTITRVPDLVIELLGRETARRNRAPLGAKFLSYQMSGVGEYYFAWPDGRDAAGFHLRDGRYVAAPQDPEGFFTSPLLGAALRLVPAALRRLGS
jgi:Uma2 family endonuclease